MKFYLRQDGTIESIYSDDAPYAELGEVSIERASHVEWDAETASWGVQFVGEAVKRTGFASRKAALEWEVAELQRRIEGAEKCQEQKP